MAVELVGKLKLASAMQAMVDAWVWAEHVVLRGQRSNPFLRVSLRRSPTTRMLQEKVDVVTCVSRTRDTAQQNWEGSNGVSGRLAFIRRVSWLLSATETNNDQ